MKPKNNCRDKYSGKKFGKIFDVDFSPYGFYDINTPPTEGGGCK